MKAKARSQGLVDNDHYEKTKNLEGDGPKWYEMLSYDDFIQHIPKLRYIRGRQAKLSFHTYEEISKVDQQIFECNSSFFRFRSQVDLLAHYIGSKFLEQIYIVRKGAIKDPLSEILESNEAQYKIWDDMKTVKDIFSNLCEKYVNGFVTQEELDENVEKYVAVFEHKEDREKMARVIDQMIEDGEIHKAKDRIRAKNNYENKQKAKERGIFEVM